MSTDRELLELAAKAAGAKHSNYPDRTPNHLIAQSADGVWRGWYPLEDDGDALRLAIKLSIEISPWPEHDSVVCEVKDSKVRIITTEALDDFGVRRAIVRAAAEIGRAMP